MGLVELSVENLRCLEHISLDLHPGHNLIWGGNASGKTSLLEAIFLLGRGRSFRTRISERLIKHDKDKFIVFGRTDGLISRTIGVQVSREGGTLAKIGGDFIPSLVELSRSFAVQIIEPGIHRLLEEGGHRRRRWMDWAVFHVEPDFVETWSGYTRVLKQRNAALRTNPEHVRAWDSELIRLGQVISNLRQSFIERLAPYWARAITVLVGIEVELHYFRGWAQGLELSEALAAARERDLNRAITHVGPHRGDVVVRIRGKPARDVLSRGQQKLVAIAMVLAQLNLIREIAGALPTLLLDDPAAELDRLRLAQFADQIAALNCQLVVTALSANSDPLGSPDRVFHVEQGRVLPV